MFKILKFAVIAALASLSFAASATCLNQIGSTTSGTTVSCTDLFGPNVAELLRPTGTNDVVVLKADNSMLTYPNGWSSRVSGNAAVWHSYDGTQGAGTTVVSGMPAGYDAIAVVRANANDRTGDVASKQATYNLPGGHQVTLQQANYLNWIFE